MGRELEKLLKGVLGRLEGKTGRPGIPQAAEAVAGGLDEVGDGARRLVHGAAETDAESAQTINKVAVPSPDAVERRGWTSDDWRDYLMGNEKRDGPADDRSEHIVLKLTQADRRTFDSLVGKLSLSGVVQLPEGLMKIEEIRGRHHFSDSEKKMVELLEKMGAEQGGKLRDPNLRLKARWISADRDHGVSQIVEDLRQNGGATQNRPWAYMADAGGGYVDEYMTTHFRDRPGVLLYYDGEKVRPLTPEEKNAAQSDPNVPTPSPYSMMPKDGLKLKDALLGMIRFDASGEGA